MLSFKQAAHPAEFFKWRTGPLWIVQHLQQRGRGELAHSATGLEATGDAEREQHEGAEDA